MISAHSIGATCYEDYKNDKEMYIYICNMDETTKNTVLDEKIFKQIETVRR